jgi:peptide-methionine (S)-S-oxide reductase
LLEIYWSGHDPTYPSSSSQYASIIFYHSAEQQRLALASKEREEERRGAPIHSELVPAGEFHPAEDYHQKYYLQNSGALMQELAAIYPNIDDFVASTAAARVNGYLGGYVSREQLDKEIGQLGLSSDGQQTLRERALR